jgi:hypothetical protein
MQVICVDVIIRIEVYRATALERLGRAVWVAMVARLTFDARLIAVVDQRLAAALRDWFFIESLFGPPENGSDE